ncbi:MarR family winged helix-turn-helix transcriptional regulator [Streptomyces sp. NPDC059909]|uniref:MarR family winged helix-turn-helix transcriptional regulator n=1 Tax=Streptomyces sp. NPDC059909 TaxID=3346998 RepID=UPI00365D1D0F
MAAQEEDAAQAGGPPVDRLGFLLAWHGGITDTLIRKALGATGLTPRQAMTLMHLADGPVTQKALIEWLAVDPSVVVGLLNDLETDGLVRRRRDPGDRRRHIVEITPEGTERLRTTDTALETMERELVADLTDRDVATLRRLLGRLRTSAEDFTCGE